MDKLSVRTSHQDYWRLRERRKPRLLARRIENSSTPGGYRAP